ncbi:hypothetical protein L6R53_00840 [Myxococcota bacterium]|nr:hypothetical protein [Myxococcota bacterium]
MGWTLFVDESGHGETPGETLVVAGLLLPAGLHDPLQRDLRARLEGIHAGLPWPPHAAMLNVPVAAAVASGTLPASQRSAALEALRLPLRELLDGVKPDDWLALRTADAAVAERYPDLYARLQALAQARAAAMARLLADLGRTAGPRGAVALVAADRVDPARDERPLGGLVVRDAYLRLLRLLLERVHALLWHDERGVEVVEAVVADRHLTLAQGDRRVPMVSRYVAEIADEAARAPFLVEGDRRRDSVRVVSTGRRRFHGEDVPAGLVLADWLANRAGRSLRRDRDLAALGASLDALALHGLPRERAPALAADGPALTTLAWGGEARRRVHEAAQRGERLPTTGLAPPRWVPEATAPWVDAAARGTWR